MEANLDETLDLKVSVLNERGETYTSLLDLYSVSIFTNQVMKKADTLQQEKENKEKQMKNSVFSYKETGITKEDEFIGKLFTTSLNRDKKINYGKEKDQNLFHYYIMGSALLSILFILFMIRYSNARRKKKNGMRGETGWTN